MLRIELLMWLHQLNFKWYNVSMFVSKIMESHDPMTSTSIHAGLPIGLATIGSQVGVMTGVVKYRPWRISAAAFRISTTVKYVQDGSAMVLHAYMVAPYVGRYCGVLGFWLSVMVHLR